MGKAENYVEGYLFDRLKEVKGLCLKFTSSVTGVPDRIVILNGKTVFVETKAGGKKPSTLQLTRHGFMRAAGGDVRVIDTREQVDDLIEEMLLDRTPDEQLVELLDLHHAYRAAIENSDDARLATASEELIQGLASMVNVQLASAEHDQKPKTGKVFQMMGRGSA